jgi:hypothetical protein
LDAEVGLTQGGNAEILCAWLVHAIRYNYAPAYTVLEHFLITTGRRKFLSPLYGELIKIKEGKERAKAIYSKARPSYRFVAANNFDNLLGKD